MLRNKMRIISILCAAAMLIGCKVGNNAALNNLSETHSETRSETSVEISKAADNGEELYIPKNKLGDGIIDGILGEYISDIAETSVMSDQNAEKLEEAFRNIRINNSRFALPMMIAAVPQGFSVKIDYDSKSDEVAKDFCLYSGELYMGDEMCATVAVMMKNGAEEKYGILIGLTAVISGMCKWSFGDIEYSNDIEKIIECFGEPSAYANLNDITGGVSYVTENGSMIIFISELNGFICITLDTDDAIENTLLAEYVPYDDFDGIPEIPKLTGEARKIDWNMIFDEDCVTIGNEKYPTPMRIGDLGEDITLFDYGIDEEYSENSDYFSDSYILMYKGREIGMVSALRKKDEKRENAVISTWMFTEYPEYRFPEAVLGIPFSQELDEILDIYIPDEIKEGLLSRYYGIAEKDGETYMCTLVLMSSTVMLVISPVSANPDKYESFLERMNAQ